MGFVFNISVLTKASNFKFGMQQEFAKARHTISCKRKSVRGVWLEGSVKIWGSPFTDFQKMAFVFNIFAMTEVAMAVPEK